MIPQRGECHLHHSACLNEGVVREETGTLTKFRVDWHVQSKCARIQVYRQVFVHEKSKFIRLFTMQVISPVAERLNLHMFNTNPTFHVSKRRSVQGASSTTSSCQPDSVLSSLTLC